MKVEENDVDFFNTEAILDIRAVTRGYGSDKEISMVYVKVGIDVWGKAYYCHDINTVVIAGLISDDKLAYKLARDPSILTDHFVETKQSKAIPLAAPTMINEQILNVASNDYNSNIISMVKSIIKIEDITTTLSWVKKNHKHYIVIDDQDEQS